MRHFLARYEAWILVALIPLVCLAGSWAISLTIPLPAEDEFNVAAWEARHLPNKWLYLVGRFFTGGLTGEEEDERLGRFLALTARIRELEAELADADSAASAPGDGARLRSLLDNLRRQRDEVENAAEAIVEGRLTELLTDAGLASSLPLFPAACWLFPPVDVEFDRTPRVLVVSPRDRILLAEQRPLRQDFTLRQALRLEEAQEASGRRSALVETVAGAATYPSVVEPVGDYQGLLEAVAHEWVHHYLFFRPLGRRYFASTELRTLNETVADMVGQELAAQVAARYPLPPELASPGGPHDPVLEAEVDRTLRQLRLDVGELLDAGQIEEAEVLMEQRRQELAEKGVQFRKINQAFFAFRSIYADDPASIDPLGLKLFLLRLGSPSVGAFLRTAAKLTGGEDLDRLLAEAAQGRR